MFQPFAKTQAGPPRSLLGRTRHALSPLSISIAAVFLLQAVHCQSVSAESNERPNIVLIMVDDMGYGDPGCFNVDSKIPTPHIDRLAREGMRFTDAHAPGPLCHLSRYGLLTGRYPFRTNVGVWPRQPVIKPERPTIASLARSQGYRTAMVGKWHLGFAEEGYDKPLPGGPVDRGFDSFFGIRASTDIPPYFYIRGDRAVQPPTQRIEANRSDGWSPIQGAFWRAGGIAPNLELEEVLPRFTQEAVSVIGDHAQSAKQAEGKSHPLMLYLAYPAPHTPWLPAEEFQGKSEAGMYGDFATMVDHQIGQLLAALDEHEMSKDTLVVFTSDNGPVWYDRDVQRFGHSSTGPLRGMKADAWEGGHRMPFVVRWPGHVQPGTSSGQLVCFTDLMATFAALWDTPLPENAGPDSFDFSPVLLNQAGQKAALRKSLVMQAGRGTMTIRSGPWKLITALGSSGFSRPARVEPEPGGPTGQLYHMENDLGETNNLFLDKPEIVERLQSELKSIRSTDGA